MWEKSTPRNVSAFLLDLPTLLDILLILPADIEDVGQQLIEDNIVAVSRQMIDKEASVAKDSTRAEQNDAMETDEEL
jgi:26S proteasome regulatory subunit N11